MKRLLTIMLFLCSISMMYAEEIEYPISIKGVRVTSSNANDVLGDGTVKFIPNLSRIEFRNANIHHEGYSSLLHILEDIGKFTNKLDVYFYGNNKLSSTNYSIISNVNNSALDPCDMTIVGDGNGTLTLEAKNNASVAIQYGKGNLFIKNLKSEINCSASGSSFGINSWKGISIENSTINITCLGERGSAFNQNGYTKTEIRNSNLTMNVPNSTYSGMYCHEPTIENSTISITTSSNSEAAFRSAKEPTLINSHIATEAGSLSRAVYNPNNYFYCMSKAADATSVKTLKILPGEYYNIKVDDVEVTSINKDDILGDNTASYSPADNVLTLNGINLESDVNAINIGKAYLTIKAVGDDNKIVSSKNGIFSNTNFSITGPGKLKVVSTATEAYAPIKLANSEVVTVKGGATVNLSGGQYGMYGGKLSVQNSIVDVFAGTAAFHDLYNLTFVNTQIWSVESMGGRWQVENSNNTAIHYDSTKKNIVNDDDTGKYDYYHVIIGHKRLGLKLADTHVDINNCNDILGDGKVRYEESTNTLYLNNATIESPESPICNETRKEFNICCSGTNSLKNTFNDPYHNRVISSNSAVNIYGSNSNASLIIEGSDGATYGICSSSPNDFSIPVNIRDIKLDMRTHANSSQAITCEYFNISNAQVYITSIGKNTWGIAGGDKQRSTCNNSIVKINGYGQGATGILANLEISNSTIDIYADAGTITYFGESGLTLTDEYIVSPTEDLSSSYQFVEKWGIYDILLNGNFAPSISFRPGTFYGLRIDGVDVSSNNKADIFNDGKASFSPDDNKLTLNGVNRISGGNGIVVGEERDGMTISLVGENKLSSYGNAFEANCDVEITGNGKLFLACLDSTVRHYPIYCHDHDLAVTNGATVTTLMPERARFGLHSCSELLVDNAYVNLAGKEGAADSLSSIDLKDGIYINKVSLDGVKYEDASDEAGVNYSYIYNDAYGESRNMCYGVKIGPKEYEGIKIAGVAIDRINKNDILGNGKVKFDPETYTLTFDNVEMLEDEIESCISIKNPGRDVTISTIGKCVFRGERYGLYIQDANVTIKGQSLEESDQITFKGGTAAASVMVSSEENTSNLTFDNSFTYFLGKYWGIIGGPFSTLTFVNSKCHCCGEGTSEGAGSLRGFKQINYEGHEINKLNPAVIKGGSAYDPSGTNILRAAWIMIEPKAASSDIDGNGTTDIEDVTRLHEIVVGKHKGSAAADLNGDGKVDIVDIVLLNEKLKKK